MLTVFDGAGVDLTKPLVATCMTGMTACAVAGAAHVLGRDVPVYYVRSVPYDQNINRFKSFDSRFALMLAF